MQTVNDAGIEAWMAGTDNPMVSQQRRSSASAWIWASIAPLTLLIYLVTSSLIVATLLPSIRAAMPAFQAAGWIRAFECKSNNRAHAAVLGLFYLADGLWLAGATAFLTVVSLAFIGPALGAQPDMTRFITAMLIITASVGLTTIVGLIATLLAWRHSVCVWVHPKMQRWCGNDERKLSQLTIRPNQLNHGVFILATSVVLPGLAVGTATLIALTATAEPMSDTMNWVATAILLFFYVLQPALAVVAYFKLSTRILARSPRDCWPSI